LLRLFSAHEGLDAVQHAFQAEAELVVGSSAVSNTPAATNAAIAGNRCGSASFASMRP
jgi:hypothetical protein